MMVVSVRASGLSLLLLLSTLSPGLTAPVPEQQNAIKDVDKRRESTKETLELEDTLKRLAGEDKKFFSNSMSQPLPQVDGLEENVNQEDEEEAALEGPAKVNPLEKQLSEFMDENTKIAPVEDAAEQDPVQTQEKPNVDQPVENNDKGTGLTEQDIQANNIALEDEMKALHKSPISGPYGPGLGAGYDQSMEYEPYADEAEQDDEASRQEGEEFFVEKVLETLRRRPDLMTELMQADEQGNMPYRGEGWVQPASDALAEIAERDRIIQAELAAIKGQRENEQAYNGDREPHVVAKKRFMADDTVIPKDFAKVRDGDINSLNRYFDAYDKGGAPVAQKEDVPIM